MSIFDKVSYNYSGTLYQSAEATTAKSRQEALSAFYGAAIDIKSTLFAVGGDNYNAAAKQIGREIGVNDTLEDDNINFDRYVSASDDKDNLLFQGEDGNLYNLNFTTGAVDEQSTEEFAEENGLIVEGDKFYDIVSFGQDSAEFIDYAFEGLGDGKQDRTEINLGNSTWSSVNWVRQEVDTSVWTNGQSDSYSSTANKAYKNIIKHASQWLTASDYTTLSKCTTYSDYIKKLAELATQRLNEVASTAESSEDTEKATEETTTEET